MDRERVKELWVERLDSRVPREIRNQARLLKDRQAVSNLTAEAGRIDAVVFDKMPVQVAFEVPVWDLAERHQVAVMQHTRHDWVERIWFGPFWRIPYWYGEPDAQASCQDAKGCAHVLAVAWELVDRMVDDVSVGLQLFNRRNPFEPSLAEAFYSQLKPSALLGQSGDRTVEEIHQVVNAARNRACRDRDGLEPDAKE